MEHLKQAWDFEDTDLISAIDELPLWSAPFGLTLLDTVEMRKNLKVLDIGPGLGFPILELAQRLGPTSHIWGIDPWKAATARLVSKMKQYGVQNVTIQNGSAEQFPFEDEIFDLITSNNGLNNITDAKKAWEECFRVAKTGAQIVATENLPRTMFEFYSVYKQVLEEIGLTKELQKMDEQIYTKRKPLKETEKLIYTAGWKIENIELKRFYMRFLDGSAFLNHFVIRLAFLESFKSILQAKDRESVFLLLEDKLNERAEQAGELILTITYICLSCRKLKDRLF